MLRVFTILILLAACSSDRDPSAQQPGVDAGIGDAGIGDAGGPCVEQRLSLLRNGSFEQGETDWQPSFYPGPPHALTWSPPPDSYIHPVSGATIASFGTTVRDDETLTQLSVPVPADATKVTISYWVSMFVGAGGSQTQLQDRAYLMVWRWMDNPWPRDTTIDTFDNTLPHAEWEDWHYITHEIPATGWDTFGIFVHNTTNFDTHFFFDDVQITATVCR